MKTLRKPEIILKNKTLGKREIGISFWPYF
jgi:hypothetical protein